jgi:hypothetical protein
MNNAKTSTNSATEIISYKCDKLTLCYTENDPEKSLITANMLIGDQMSKSIPGSIVISNSRYKATARIPITVDEDGNKELIVFEAGPRRPGMASYRLEFNPSKLKAFGIAQLHGVLGTLIDLDLVVFMAMAKVTRLDAALDLHGLCLENVIVKAAGLRKHGVYSDQHGNPQTVYLGTPKSRRVVAYDKDLDGDGVLSLRLECRVKPYCSGHEIASMKNPFEKVRLIPANFMAVCNLGIPDQILADGMRIGGLKRVLPHLDKKQRNLLKHAFAASISILPDPASLWAAWPETLISYGLGKELGAIPITIFVPKAA